MENQSLYLPLLEVILGIFGLIIFIYNILFQKINVKSFAMLLLVLIPTLIYISFYDDVRHLPIKAILMLAIIYLSSRFPKQLVFLLGCITLTGFILDNLINNIFISKHVGENLNQILTVPFLLVCATFFLAIDKFYKYLNILYLVAIFEFCIGFYFDVRNACLSAILFITVLASNNIAKLIVRYGSFLPLIYMAAMFLLYKYYFAINLNDIDINPSNIERSSMVYASLVYFFSYVIQGPGSYFDVISSDAMKSLSSKFNLYSSNYGADPHVFFMSLWRSTGSLITILWFIYWLFYWNQLRKVESMIDHSRVRLSIALLAISLVSFSMQPPSIGFRILVSVLMGACLAQADASIKKFRYV